jgi:hypothetical protein
VYGDPMVVTETIRSNLKAIVAAYRQATGTSLSKVSKDFYGNGNFFDQFFKGEVSISLSRLDEMLVKFRRNWPENTEWPYWRAVLSPPPAPK